MCDFLDSHLVLLTNAQLYLRTWTILVSEVSFSLKFSPPRRFLLPVCLGVFHVRCFSDMWTWAGCSSLRTGFCGCGWGLVATAFAVRCSGLAVALGGAPLSLLSEAAHSLEISPMARLPPRGSKGAWGGRGEGKAGGAPTRRYVNFHFRGSGLPLLLPVSQLLRDDGEAPSRCRGGAELNSF